MRSHTAILIYTLALLLPALIVAGVLARLLAHERERLAKADEAAVISQARSIANQIIVTTDSIKSTILQRLSDLPASNIAKALRQWEQTDPLVRNVFVLQADNTLLLPDTTGGLSNEEQAFVRRYETLFSGQIAWNLAAAPDPSPATESSAKFSRPLASQNFRRSLASIATEQNPTRPARTTGWIPWFAGRDTFFLAWALLPDGKRYGIELEFNFILSGLLSAFPDNVINTHATVLLDGQGNVMHVTGANLPPPNTPRLAEISLSPALPHWQLAVIRSNAPKGNFHLLMMVAAIFCAILMMAIAVSGWLLLRDASRHRRDAQTKTSFVANVSHELKTPLTTIRLYAEMLSEGRAKDPAKQRHYLEVIVQESQRLARLIGNVLDFGRLEQGRKNYHVTIFDAAAAMTHFVNMHRERLQKAGMEIILHDDSPCPVACDQDAFEQTLLNLLDNAIKYAAKGKSISFTAATGDDRVIIKICDRGPGIPPRQLRRLFQPFYRSDDSMTTTQPGCGLGLSISRRLMRDLGGDLRYEANAGGGACFVITMKGARANVTEALRQPKS